MEGTIKCDAVERAKCQVDFGFGVPGDYRVVSTDYTTYSIVYSCSQGASNYGGATPVDLVWILSRKEALDDKEKEHALQIIKEKLPAYDTKQLVWSKQGGDCKYYDS